MARVVPLHVEVAAEEAVVVAVEVAEVVEADMSINSIPSLGVGLSFRSQLFPEVIRNQTSIDFLEIIADHYFDAHRTKLEELDILKRHFSVIPHAINLSLGSPDPVDERYLNKLNELIQFLDPPYWSEHISYSSIEGIEIGHLSPLPFNNHSLDILTRKIETVQNTITVPLILENISYLVNLPGHEMSEGVFLKKLCERTDCGFLLDVTNLFYNSQNHNYHIEEFLELIPLEKVVQLHFTGGIYQEGKYIDNHSSRTPEEVWQLIRKIVNQKRPKGLILERDDSNPDFSEILRELEKARQVMENNG